MLLDDNFAHIVEAVEEGRAAFDNIRRFLTYHLTDNVAELTPFVVWALSGGSIPLMITVLQVLALDIGTDLLPALALGVGGPEPGIDAAGRPATASARLLGRRVIGRAFGFLGPVEAVGVDGHAARSVRRCSSRWPDLRSPWTGPRQGDPVHDGVRRHRLHADGERVRVPQHPGLALPIGPLGNRLLVGAVLIEALALLAFVYVPPLAGALGMQPLEPAQWLPVLVTPLVLVAAEEARKAIVRARLSPRARQ